LNFLKQQRQKEILPYRARVNSLLGLIRRSRAGTFRWNRHHEAGNFLPFSLLLELPKMLCPPLNSNSAG
jgi:hypothetical protein